MLYKEKAESFRSDINGLRAWAVLAVIFYHFEIPGFVGGFVGVDVFFVISGYLMTRIIISGIEHSSTNIQFSLLSFYLARARRIVPALLVLCAVLLLFGWFWLPAIDYQMLGKHIFSALGFFSNFVFWREAGYFGVESHDKWLLHTWSLSVEWQFYIILPLVLLGLWKLRPTRSFIVTMMILGFVLSLGFSIYFSPTKSSAAFYLLPTRAWEMLAGGLVFLLAEKTKWNVWQEKMLEILGFLLVLYSIFFITSEDIWPGYLAIIPVIGVVLILLANRENSFFTATLPAQWLGNCSYSLYLWHWPLAVALNFASLQGNYFAIIVALLLTLVFGYISFAVIEKLSRTRLNRISNSGSLIVFSALLGVVVLPGLAISLHGGVAGRLPAHIDEIVAEANNRNPRREECHVSDSIRVPECTYGGDKLGVIVIGDSHGASIVRSVEKALPSNSLHVLDWTLSACPTILGIKKTNAPGYGCDKFLSHAFEAQKHISPNIPIIIANRISGAMEGPNESERANEAKPPVFYFDKLFENRNDAYYQEITSRIINSACELAKIRSVYMVRPIPEFKLHVPNAMGRALLLGNPTRVAISRDEYHQRHRMAIEAQDLAHEKCGVKILDPLPYLCDENSCYGDKDGMPIYYDDNHLSERGGQLLIPMFAEVFK